MQPDLMADFQQQCHGILGHGSGSVAGYVGDGDAPIPGCLTIHHIVACGQYTDVADAGTGIQNGFRDGCLVGEDNFGSADPLNRLPVTVCARVDGVFSELIQCFPAQVAGIQGSAIQNDNFHG